MRLLWERSRLLSLLTSVMSRCFFSGLGDLAQTVWPTLLVAGEAVFRLRSAMPAYPSYTGTYFEHNPES